MKKGEFPSTLMFQVAFPFPFFIHSLWYAVVLLACQWDKATLCTMHTFASTPPAHNEAYTLMVYLTFCRGFTGKVTPALAWTIWQHLNRAAVIGIDAKAACAMKKPQCMLLWLPKGSTNTYCQVQVHLQLKVKQKRTGNFEKQKCRNACLRFLACLLDSGHVSFVWVQFDSRFASANNSFCCYKKAKYWWVVLSGLGLPIKYSCINGIQQHIQLMFKSKFLCQGTKYK